MADAATRAGWSALVFPVNPSRGARTVRRVPALIDVGMSSSTAAAQTKAGSHARPGVA